MRALFDTNIIIDYLNGIPQAKKEIEQFNEGYISIITYIEVIVGLPDASLITLTKDFLHSFNIVDVNIKIAETSIKLRKKYKLKVPDAIILASAEHEGALFITRDNKDFADTLPIVKVPYIL